MPSPDTRDVDSLAGAMYFIVGRGTEAGRSPYRLTIAGISYQTAHTNWGESKEVAANSGYSLGTIQVDLGQRGAWPLGATENRSLRPGQTTYVDGLIAQASKYAERHRLSFASDKAQLRADLLTHGNGERRRSTLIFIDTGTRDSINAWASSEEGQKWIHQNVDYPQIRSATQSALDILDTDGRNITENRRFEAIALLTKTANQMPSQLGRFRQILRNGGNYDDLLANANDMVHHHRYYAGPKAAALAERYKNSYMDVEVAAALDRAQAKVADADFNPLTSSSDRDFQEALKAIGQAPPVHVLRRGSRGNEVAALQTRLMKLGIADAHGHALDPDGAFSPGTQAAVETFQRTHGLNPDGLVGPKTLETLQDASRLRNATLADRGHPGNALFRQALHRVHLIDAQCGRTPDASSSNLAGSLAAAAHAQGLACIDHVLLGENATRAFAVQGDPGSPFKQVACVDLLQAVARPLEQSSDEFHLSAQPVTPQRAMDAYRQAPARPILSGIQP